MPNKDEGLVNRELLFQLMKSEERYQNFMNAATDSIFINNLDGLFLDANHAACNALGYTHKEIIGMSVWDIEIGFSEKIITELSLQLMQGPFNVEGLHRRKDGTTFPVDVRMSAFKSMDETMILAIVRDITEEKIAQSTIKKLTYALERVSSMVIITDRSGTIEYVNAKVLAQTGYDYDQLVGQNARILQSGKTPSATFKFMWDQLNNDKTWHGELLNTDKKGANYLVSAIISPILDETNDKPTHYLAIMDIL